MTKLKSKSPAKVNLTFKVIQKRPDGYHDIETLMQAVTLCDWVSLSFSDRDQLTCSDPIIPIDHSNLAWQAVKLFRQKTNLQNSVSIHIEKHIPAGAGLGGGSSNAATTLFMLNTLFGDPVDEQNLKIWSAEIGSDVPFFFSAGTALCTGRGEITHSRPVPERLPNFIAKPKKLRLATPSIYRLCKPGESLEPAAFRALPELSDVKDQLCTLGFDKIFMTGSGSSFICYGEGTPKAAGIDFYPIDALRKKTGEWYT